MWVRVLGPSQVALGEDPADTVDIGARKPRSVVAALAMRLGHDVSPDALVDLVWGEEAPRGAHGTLHSYLSSVRRVLEPGLGPRQKPTVLLTSDHGYRLHLPRERVDALRFTDEVGASRRALAPLATQLTTGPTSGWPDRATISGHVDRLEGLLGLWSGEAYADLPDHPDVVLERSSLDQLRRGAEEDRVLGLLALGDHAVVVAATEQATARYPLQERVWGLHALALVRSGRQAEALTALRRIRRTLADELGLDPGQELRDLEQAVLRQDAVLQQWQRAEATAAVAPAPTSRVAPTATRWGTVGRDREVADLDTVLDRAEAGEPSFALLVGEPGIGKSRLVEGVSEAAAARGFVVATGRCAQDDGAPPLWAWSQALDDLGRHDGRVLDVELARLLTGAAGLEPDERQGFRAWESIAREVLTRSEGTPLLLVLEDLHWADTGSLRVLRRLISSSVAGQRLAVVLTRRPFPEPTGSLADVGEELARRHATRIDLTGLDADATRALVAQLADDTEQHVVDQWHARSGGNPFFLIELARLGGGADPQALPATVRDVVTRRFAALPAETRSLLLLAAALGREFSLDVLAAVAGQDPDEVEAALAPARDASLLREPGPGLLAFAHALTRDAVAATTTATALARLHARIAHALDEGGPVAGLVAPEERVAELARHWLAAGPSYVGRAWRSAVEAAAQARRTFSWVEAEQLMGAAIAAHRRDPLGTPEERIDLLLTRARDCRPNAEWNQVLPCAAEAMSLARRAGDLDRLAAAAAAASDNLVWLSQQWNEVLEDTVDDLRWGLVQLPPSDSPERCRLMLALAVQLYYDPSARAEVVALADEGHAMARRLDDDPALRWWASHTAWKALWSPTHLARRLELCREGLEAAVASGDEDSLAIAQLLVAATALEAGDRATFIEHLRESERVARRRRNAYAQMAVAWMHMSLAAMSGDDEGVARHLADVVEHRPRLNPVMETVQVAAAQLISQMWTGAISAMVQPLVEAGLIGGDDMSRGIATLGLARGDRLDLLRTLLADPPRYAVESWASTDTWCGQAEAAAVAGDVRLAEEVAGHLGPLSGRLSMSGISVVMGPVDGYLALALVGCGRSAEAAAAADRAVAQAEDWGLSAYTAWLRGRREQLGF